jgi:type I restriction enzyme M protein
MPPCIFALSFLFSNFDIVPTLSVTLDEIRGKDYVLTPGRYIGLPEDEDDFDFAERFGKLTAELNEQMKEEARLNDLIRENLSRLDIKQS